MIMMITMTTMMILYKSPNSLGAHTYSHMRTSQPDHDSQIKTTTTTIKLFFLIKKQVTGVTPSFARLAPGYLLTPYPTTVIPPHPSTTQTAHALAYATSQSQRSKRMSRDCTMTSAGVAGARCYKSYPAN